MQFILNFFLSQAQILLTTTRECKERTSAKKVRWEKFKKAKSVCYVIDEVEIVAQKKGSDVILSQYFYLEAT